MDTLSTQPTVATGRKTRHKTRRDTRPKSDARHETGHKKAGHKTHGPTVASEGIHGWVYPSTPFTVAPQETPHGQDVHRP